MGKGVLQGLPSQATGRMGTGVLQGLPSQATVSRSA